MAQRRMFSLKVIDTDEFLDMPQSTQLLYFHLSLRADDDGFVSSPKKIMKMVGANDDDMKVLFVKKFVIPFESGVCVIRHWRVHNYIQSDRYQATQYKLERSMLQEEDGIYLDNRADKPKLEAIADNVSKMDTQVRLGKDNNILLQELKSGDNSKSIKPTIKEKKQKLEKLISEKFPYKDELK